MSIYNLFSKRQKALRGEISDVYTYDVLPKTFKVQVVHIVNDTLGQIGEDRRSGRGMVFGSVRDVVCREYGLLRLFDDEEEYQTLAGVVLNFFLQQTNIEVGIDIIELLFQRIDIFVRNEPGFFAGNTLTPDEAIDELNTRFRENGLGYEFVSGQIIRVDSQFTHQEVIKPALLFLQARMYKGANEEFLSAHRHYREGKHKECLNDCLKAFESTLKIICGKRKWHFKTTDTAKILIEIVFEKELIPSFLQSHLTGLRTTLESGIPTVRNKLSGHGQGMLPVEVPEYIASYALHLTASNILILAKANEALK